MKKIIYIVALGVLVSAGNSNAGLLDTIRSWFTPNPGPRYTELPVEPYRLKDLKNEYPDLSEKVDAEHPRLTMPIGRQVIVPLEQVDPNKQYKVIGLGNKVYYEEIPSNVVILPTATKPLEKEMKTFYLEQPRWRRIFTRMRQPLHPSYKYYVSTPNNEGPMLSIVKKQPSFTTKAEAAFARTQMTE